MAEPTLNLQLKEIQARLGNYAGWGRGALYGETAWTTSQQAVIDDSTQSGLRCFYYPEPMEGMDASHDWTFLHPRASGTLAATTSVIDLPDDFGGVEGDVTLNLASARPFRIEWRNEGNIRQMFSALPEKMGPPMYVGLIPKRGTTGTSSQRSQLIFFPIADVDYPIAYTYYINPDYLTTAFPYAMGGPQHAETLIESCLACMESRLDDSLTVHAQLFRQRLAASIGADRKNRPQKYGLNRDRSDETNRVGPSWMHGWGPAITYNGGSFD